MTTRAELVVRGQVVVAAEPRGLETVEAIGIARGRVVSAGSAADVTDAAARGARVIDAGRAAVIPGMHDFHIHLVGLARTRGSVLLDDAADGAEVAARLRAAASRTGPSAWITGRGWSEAQLGTTAPSRLAAAVGERLAFVTSHDGHSAWASPAALRLAGVGASTPDPPGGRIERDAHGDPTGILRETALDLVAAHVARVQGERLRPLLDETLRELASYGITGASEAGDYTDEGGIGPDAAFGDSFSSLTDLRGVLDGRLRMNIGIPVDAVDAALERGMGTAQPIAGTRTLRFGWAKEYSDGALGSGTAALFQPRSCRGGGTGILRVDDEGLDDLFRRAHRGRVALAIHAIGDRAAATVLDAAARAPASLEGVPNDRMEHAQLVRAVDRARFADLGVIASVQPIHAAADRDLVEECWSGRQDDAYAWRSLLAAGARLAAGSDAPVESVNPWLGVFAAVHRRFPTDPRADWRAGEALTVAEALSAYTLAPARAVGADDEGTLRPGARADLAVLSTDLETLLQADERLAEVRSVVTFVDGVEVPVT